MIATSLSRAGVGLSIAGAMVVLAFFHGRRVRTPRSPVIGDQVRASLAQARVAAVRDHFSGLARFVVIGAPGSGKTTVARALAEKLRLEYVELDAVLHGPGGIEPSNDDFRAAVLPKLEGDAWVVDGWHERKLGTLVLERADVAVFLDPGVTLIVGRLLRRTLPEILRHTELWNGNRQTWRGAFGGSHSLFGYALRRHRSIRSRVRRLQNDQRFGTLEWVHLVQPRDVREWLTKRTA